MPFDEDKPGIAAVQGRKRLHGAFAIELSRIEADPNQPRKSIDAGYLEELTQSVKQLGVLQPISVRFLEEYKRYRIVAGECRFQAAKAAGLAEIPCWVKTPSEDKVLLEQIVENWLRSDLNPFELADSLAILRDSNGLSQKELARDTGKSKGEISKLLSILELDPAAQSLARGDSSGRISKRHLYAVSRLPGETQATIVERIAQRNLTAVDVERLVKRQVDLAARGDRRGAHYSRRVFKIQSGHVVFTFRGDGNSDEDVLRALHEVRREIVTSGSAD